MVKGQLIEFALDAVTNDPLALELLEGRLPDDVTSELWRHLIQPGHSVIDAGAHLGTFSLPAARIGARVLAVEASPSNSTLLQLAARRNSFDEIHVLSAAVSSGPGATAFTSHGPWGHVASPNEHSSPQIPTVALDDVLAQIGWDRVDLIKIDVEGSEIPALTGLRKLLDRDDAPPIIIESNAHTLHHFGSSPGELIAVLERSGYGCHLIDRVHGRRLVPVRATDVQPECFVDYLAFKAGPPQGLQPWQISQAFERSEIVDRVAATCQSTAQEIREYGERLLADGPDWLTDGVKSLTSSR